MKRRIFLLEQEGGLREMVEEGFATEELLQALLAEHPALLAGDQIDEKEPRRWLLVCREAGVPDREEGSDRWALDHLFLDQDGVPTLVEVKRSTDTRIRREVLGQMLDYAANGLAYWPEERVEALFDADCARLGHDPELRVREFLEAPHCDVGAFWQKVKTNLQAGRIRMVFVADEIPAELRRIVEFLNAQMDPAEVLAVAVRQYVGEGMRTLVPQVIGLTAEAETRKGGGRPQARTWDEASFFEALDETSDAATREGTRRIYEWAKQHLPRMTWGRGSIKGSCMPVLDLDGEHHWPIALWTTGELEIAFTYLARQPPFDDESRRRELLERLNRVPGVNLPPDAYSRKPNFPLAILADDESWAALESVLDWYLRQIGAEPEGAG